jgi:hypothetical protein
MKIMITPFVYSITPVIYNIPFCFPNPKEMRAFLLEELKQIVKPSEKFIAKHGGSQLTFAAVLERKTIELKVLGPSTGDDLVFYTIWLPYKKIKYSDNYKLEYLNSLEEGMMQIFKKYDFDLK